MLHLHLVIDGKPVAKGRPRFRQTKQGVSTYTPKTTATWETVVGWQVRDQLAGLTVGGLLTQVSLPLSGRVLCALRFNLPRPKSEPKRTVHHLRKPDPDNLSKSVLDALETVGVLANDSIVTDLSIAKRFADPEHPAGVEIDLTAWLG